MEYQMNKEIIEQFVHGINQIPGVECQVSFSPEFFSMCENNGDMLFETYAHRWLDNYCKGKVKHNTYDGTYRQPVELHLIPFFGQYYLNEITPDIVQEFFNGKIYTSAFESLKKMRMCLNGIFEEAVANKICHINPVTSRIRLISKVPPDVKDVWTKEQYDLAWKYAKTHPNGLDVLLMMETGISRSELLGLHCEDHDSTKAILSIERGRIEQKNPYTHKYEIVEDGLKNEHRERLIPLSKELNALLLLRPKYILVGGSKKRGIPPKKFQPAHIIYAPRGGGCKPSNWSNRTFKAFMSDLHDFYPDVPILRPHELRHTRATLLTNQGTSVYFVSRLLGHRDLEMLSKRYAHFDVEALRAAIYNQ